TEDFKKSSGAKAEKPETKKKEKPVKEKKVKKLAPIKKSDVWEQGILTTINQKIEEIEDVQRELDEVIDSKVQKHLEEEKKKMNTLIESQYSLLYEKINSVLDEKVNELNNALEEKTEKFNKLSKSVASGIAKQAEEKASYEQLLEEIEKRIEDLPDLKKRLVSKVEEETEQMKNSSKKFIEEAEEGMNEMDERINKALELETKIIEGLVKDTEERIQEMAEKRSNFLSGELKVKLDELTELKKSLTPGFVQEKTKELSVKMEAKMQEMISLKEREIDEAIEIKTKELDSLKQKMAGAEQLTKAAAEIEKLSSFKEDLQNQLNQSKQEIENLKGELKKFIGAQLIEASSETEEKINELFERRKDELALFQKKSQGIDVDKFEQKMQELDSFKEQFTEIIQKNISSIKRTREEMISELDTKGSLIDGKINQINSKMEELSAFEKNFAREMGLAVEKLIEKKKVIKPSQPKPKPASKKKEERDDYIRKAFKERIRKAKKGR
ncbi:hypothetical protein KJ660_03865, partial [Candidatus Micrarchaeota archaeon]|nr:hypothetical protein [Candidatus Micrarchaeota archaeon]